MASFDQVLSSLIVETLKTYKKENKNLLFVMSRAYIDRYFVFETQLNCPFAEIERYLSKATSYKIEVSIDADGRPYIDLYKNGNNFDGIKKAQSLFSRNGTYSLTALYRGHFISERLYKIQAVNHFRNRLGNTQYHNFNQALADGRVNLDQVVELESVVSHTFNGNFDKAVEACTGSSFQNLMGLKTLDILSLRSGTYETESQENSKIEVYNVRPSTANWLTLHYGSFSTIVDPNNLGFNTWVLPDGTLFQDYISNPNTDDLVEVTTLSIQEIIDKYNLSEPAPKPPTSNRSRRTAKTV